MIMSASRPDASLTPFRPLSHSPAPDPRMPRLPPPSARRQRSADDDRSTSPFKPVPARRAPAAVDSPAQDDVTEGSAPSTTSSAPRSGDSIGSVCLCPPEPKIPRPRNAFMLYRQHYQASVVAQNPGLANPEISKIIGRQWREESQEVKDSWDTLADEEKQRHHRQYPNYKYQPRRKGKKGSASGEHELPMTSEEWCAKCGRRNLTTPATPMTPYTPAPASSNASAGRAARQLPPVAGSSGTSPNRRPRPEQAELSVRAASASAAAAAAGRGPYPSSSDEAEALSPQSDAKRRRVEPVSVDEATAGMRRVSLPRPDMIHGRMKPPPRPSMSSAMQDEPDATLTLPPLRSTQSRSVENTVMAIPFLNKIKVLAKICPPMTVPPPMSPPPAIRGAVVAVDGDDERVIQHVARWLEDDLAAGGRHAVKVFDPAAAAAAAAAEPTEAARPPETFVDYLRSIASWHGASQAIIRYITSVPSAEATVSPSSSPPPPRTPIALIPSFMLTRSNQAATRIPINDAYAPVDHWQWAATLWRGIVGPDVTIWIRECSDEELRRTGAVEVREDARTLVIKRTHDEDVDERALRRLGFEVSEALRAITKT